LPDDVRIARRELLPGVVLVVLDRVDPLRVPRALRKLVAVVLQELLVVRRRVARLVPLPAVV
jgi:hypothetical protein